MPYVRSILMAFLAALPIVAQIVTIQGSDPISSSRVVLNNNFSYLDTIKLETASNVGSAGTGLFKQKSGKDLQFYKIASANSLITVDLSGTDYLRLTMNPTNFGNITLSGNLSRTGMTDGCASWTTGILGSTGAPCGSGSGGVSSFSVTSVPSFMSASVATATTTPALTLSMATGQTANRFLATPDGTTGAISPRAIVAADLPSLATIYQPLDTDLTQIAALACSNGQIIEKVAGAWACAADDTGTGSGTANLRQQFTSQTSITVTHSANSLATITQCFDTSVATDGIEVEPLTITNGLNANVVTFNVATSGYCTVNSSGGGSGGGSGITTMTTGASDPVAACTAPSTTNIAFYTQTTSQDLWACVATNTWKKVFSTSNTGAYRVTGTTGATPTTPATGDMTLYFDSSAKVAKSIDDAGLVSTMMRVYRGTASMTTAAIAAGACGTTVTVAATGVAATDVITFNPNASVKAVTGYTPGGGLSIRPWPTANNVNFEVCNETASSITPGAVTINWQVAK